MSSDDRPTVLVVQNGKNGGPRRFGDWLVEDRLRLDVVHAYDGATPPETLTHDAVLVLGGGYMPDADDRAPWLAQTRALVAEALPRGVPVFGICLGGQLLAHVAGGAVKADAGAPETGSVPVSVRPEAATDPLFHDLPSTVPAIEHHVDAVTALPADAVWLAQTERCPYQAFRVGERAWGVQFHPEVTADRIAQWDADKLRREGHDRDEVLARALADEPVSTPVWREVCRRFATVVHESAA
ncbi:MAG TPA: type 1 glutamine amidotransferase [Streptosporangiales bacterium]